MLLVLCLGALILAATPLFAQGADEEIVFLDPNGFVRVKDTTPQGSRALVQWASPIGGYVDFALIDANNDGDMEIVALRGADAASALDIYDPVITSGTFDPAQVINGIPWTKLYELPLPDDPGLIAVGELDTAVAGDEIVYSYRVVVVSPDGDKQIRQRFRVLRSAGDHDGRTWDTSSATIEGEDWSSIAIGDLDDGGTDEIALVNKPDGVLSIYRLVNGVPERFFNDESNSRAWQHVAMGRWLANARLRVGAVRDAPLDLSSLFVLRYSVVNGEMRSDYEEKFDPSPSFVFFADVNGNGDDELFMLRSVPSDVPGRVRLMMRKNPASTGATILLEDVLDADNGYRAGSGGDIDGDGKDEVVLMRNDKLRYYLTPDVTTTYSEEALATDARHIEIGDLDRNGYIQELRLAVSSTRVEGTARSGEQAQPVTFQVSNGVNSQPLPFAWTIDGSPSWVIVTSSSTQTPATLTVLFDASALREGLYTTNLLLTSSEPLVFQQPVAVELRFNVTEGMLVEPSTLAFVQSPCTAPLPTQSLVAEINASAGLSYTVVLLDEDNVNAAGVTAGDAGAPQTSSASDVVWPSSVAWASAFSATGVAPESLTVTVDFSKTNGSFDIALGVVFADIQGQRVVRRLGITALCADHQVYLPLIAK